jgi:hypothetical protein
VLPTLSGFPRTPYLGSPQTPIRPLLGSSCIEAAEQLLALGACSTRTIDNLGTFSH